MNAYCALLEVLREPSVCRHFPLSTWDLLLRQARQRNVLASLGARLRASGAIEDLPMQVREHFTGAQRLEQHQRHTVLWEITQIHKALQPLGVPVVLLKGAAYVAADLPLSYGRLFSDIDIMVPKKSLSHVESALMQHGWEGVHSDPYDQYYYRTWMHEIPPMRHIKRLTEVDVHHTIVPETSSFRPEPGKLFSKSVDIAGHNGMKVLSSCDMVLHSAVHLFSDGQNCNALRDLIDIDALLRLFCNSPEFWQSLLSRGHELELSRFLFYALRYSKRFLDTPVPDFVLQSTETSAPSLFMQHVMDGLFERAILPDASSHHDWLTPAANLALYLRGHWLRMPPVLLFRHLTRKTFNAPKKQYG